MWCGSMEMPWPPPTQYRRRRESRPADWGFFSFGGGRPRPSQGRTPPAAWAPTDTDNSFCAGRFLSEEAGGIGDEASQVSLGTRVSAGRTRHETGVLALGVGGLPVGELER